MENPATPLDPASLLAANSQRIRDQLLSNVRFIKSDAKGGVEPPFASQRLVSHVKERRIFCVHYKGLTLYPRFQVDEQGQPHPIMAEILDVVPTDAHGWSLLSWFEARNVLLGGERPIAALSRRPREVYKAAASFYAHLD